MAKKEKKKKPKTLIIRVVLSCTSGSNKVHRYRATPNIDIMDSVTYRRCFGVRFCPFLGYEDSPTVQEAWNGGLRHREGGKTMSTRHHSDIAKGDFTMGGRDNTNFERRYDIYIGREGCFPLRAETKENRLFLGVFLSVFGL